MIRFDAFAEVVLRVIGRVSLGVGRESLSMKVSESLFGWARTGRRILTRFGCDAIQARDSRIDRDGDAFLVVHSGLSWLRHVERTLLERTLLV